MSAHPAQREQFEHRLKACTGIGDLLALSREAMPVLEMTQDKQAAMEFCRECYLQAEKFATTVDEYHDIARAAVTGTGDHGYATQLIEQALQIPMQDHPWRTAIKIGVELHVPGNELKRWLGRLIQAPARSQRTRRSPDTASSSSGPAFEDIILAAQTLRDELAAPDTAKRLISDAGDRFQSVAQACAGVEKLGKLDEHGWASLAFEKASALCVTIPDLARLARCTWSVFGDASAARDLLGNAEADCQNTQEFLQLAQVYKSLFQDHERVDELMELATEYAIELEDKIHLAQGYWRLSGNIEAASSAWSVVLDELDTFDTLLNTASVIANELGNQALARQYLLKASQQATGSQQWLPIIELVATTLNDNTHAKELTLIACDQCGSFEERFTITRSSAERDDLTLSDNLLRLTASRAESVDHYLRLATLAHTLLAPTSDHGTDSILIRDFLNQAERRSQVCDDLLDTADFCETLLNDRHLIRNLYREAEQRICSVEEATRLLTGIQRIFPTESEWQQQIQIVKSRWQKRETGFRDYQECFESAPNLWGKLQLCQRILAESGDRNLTRKFLIKTEQFLHQQAFDLDATLQFSTTLYQLLDEPDWASRLYEHAVIHCHDVVCLGTLCDQTGKHVHPETEARRLVRRFCQHFEQTNTLDCLTQLQLAWLVYRHLQDRDWACKLATHSMTRDTASPLKLHDLAWLLLLNEELGDNALAHTLLPTIQALCESVSGFVGFARHCRQLALSEATLRSLYQLGEHWFPTPRDKLVWAEGIVDCLDDRDWANREYHELARMFRPGAEQERFQLSWHARLASQPDAPPAAWY